MPRPTSDVQLHVRLDAKISHAQNEEFQEDIFWTKIGGPCVDMMEDAVKDFYEQTGLSKRAALTYLVGVLCDRMEIRT